MAAYFGKTAGGDPRRSSIRWQPFGTEHRRCCVSFTDLVLLEDDEEEEEAQTDETEYLHDES